MSIGAAFAAVLGLTAPPQPTPMNAEGSVDGPMAVAWARDLPGPPVSSASHSELGAPVIHGNTVYVGSAGSNALYALSRGDGTVLYKFEANGPVQSAPVIADERIVFADAAGYTWSYPLEGGDPYWKHYGGAPVLSSPTLEDDTVLVTNVGSAVYALNAEDGSLNWRHVQESDASRRMRLELYGAPSPVVNGEQVLCGFHDGSLVALSLKSGERLWQRRVGEGRYPDIIAPPVVNETDAIVAGFSEPLMSLDLDSRNVRWRLDAGGTQAVTMDGHWVFHGGGDGVLRAIDSMSGSVRWSWEAPRGGALTQPLVTSAGLLVGSDADSLYLIDDEDGALLWTLETGVRLSGITAGVAVDGRQAVIVTNAGRIISLVVPKDEPAWVRDIGILPGERHE